MNNMRIYPGRDGWFYEVWIASRVVVFGWAKSQDRAAQEAGLLQETSGDSIHTLRFPIRQPA